MIRTPTGNDLYPDHRSYIVNANSVVYVKMVGGLKALISNGASFPRSPHHISVFRVHYAQAKPKKRP